MHGSNPSRTSDQDQTDPRAAWHLPALVGMLAAVLLVGVAVVVTDDSNASDTAAAADVVADAYGADERTFEPFLGASTLARIAVSVRRLHDAGHSGWFYLFSVFGLGVVTLVLCAMETSPAAAAYGPPYPQGYAPGGYGYAAPNQGYGPPPGQQQY